MVRKQDEQALDWYSGRQSIVPVQSILHERHYYFDDEAEQRYRACELFGMDGVECVLGGRQRSGGMGVVDMKTGRLVIHIMHDATVPRQTGPLAREIAALRNGRRRHIPGQVSAGRHAVTTNTCPRTGALQTVLCDTRRRTLDGTPYPICRVYADPNNAEATRDGEVLLARLAAALDDTPLDWKALRRNR